MNNIVIQHAIEQTKTALSKSNNIMVSISGGSDSDIVLDIVKKLSSPNQNIHYVFFNTGLEYNATINHLTYLEDKYNIEIERQTPIKSIPKSCVDHGIPFLSKNVSEYIQRLQAHNFDWIDRPHYTLKMMFPFCESAINWFTNQYDKGSPYNIDNNKKLKQFLELNPPTFKISNKCCDYTKKDIANQYKKDHDIDLSITGIRKAEGGVRSTRFNGCYTEKANTNELRPLWYFTDKDKKEYDEQCKIIHSECYTKYGMYRTGCAGCPYALGRKKELTVMEQYEPKLFKVVNNVFGKSYEYTDLYTEFKKS